MGLAASANGQAQENQHRRPRSHNCPPSGYGRGDGIGTAGIGIKTSPALGDVTAVGSSGRGGAAAKLLTGVAGVSTSCVTGVGVAATFPGAGRGNGIAVDIFGRARGSGTGSLGIGRALLLISGRNSGRSRSSIWDNICGTADVVPIAANTSIENIVFTPKLMT